MTEPENTAIAPVTYLLETYSDRDRLYNQFEMFQGAFSQHFERGLGMAGISGDPSEINFRALDIGCGEGLYVNMLNQRYPQAKLVGFDIDNDGITTASNIFGNANVSFYNQNMLEPFSSQLMTDKATGAAVQYDIAFAFLSVVHTRDPKAALNNVFAALRPGGVIYLCETLPKLVSYPEHNFTVLMGAVDTAARRISSLDFPDHHKEYLNEAGFGQVETDWVEYPMGGTTTNGQRLLRHAVETLVNTRRGIVALGVLEADDYDARLNKLRHEVNPDTVGTWTNIHTLAVKPR